LPYCRRCGTKLDEDAHFCHKCGTPVATYLPPPPPPTPIKPIRKKTVIIAAIALSAILIVGLIVVTLLSAPFSTMNFNQSYQDNSSNINRLNLNVQIDEANVNVFTQKVNNSNYILTLTGSGSKSPFGDGNNDSPIIVAFHNGTANDVLTVAANITKSAAFSRFNMECNIYLNPAIKLNLNVISKAGQISLTADKPATFESLNLQANAGNVQTNLQNVTIIGNVILETQAGTVDFRTNQIIIEGNNSIDLHSNAGSINMDITQTKILRGNIQINASTDLGSINIDLVIDGDVGAKIISQTNLGSINVNEQHFSGNQSPIQSDNYPAVSNIEINSRTNLGNININTVYQSLVAPSIRN
jgi:hypothetical protein